MVDMLTFFTILGFCSTVLIWYIVNNNSGKGGEDGFLALIPDEFDGERSPDEAPLEDHSRSNNRFNKQDDELSDPHAIRRVNLKARHAPGNNTEKKRRYRQKHSESSREQNSRNRTSAQARFKEKKRVIASAPKPKFRVKEKSYDQIEQDEIE